MNAIDSEGRVENLAGKLKTRGMRITPQRMAVLKIIATSTKHPSIEQIYEQVKRDFPMTSLATIYKTINTLEQMGEVREITLHDGGNRYDGYEPAPHPHFVCTECGKISDVDIANLTQLADEVAEKYGYQIYNQRLDFFGVCSDCQKTITKSR